MTTKKRLRKTMDPEDLSESEDVKNENDDEEMKIDTSAEQNLKASRPNYPRKKSFRRTTIGARKPFRCTTCNYVTNVKARFTKHVKYHSMPLIKCDFCDFKTPYKWNLDRHLKNHTGEGSLSCPLCNFRCDIKQSLTVHVQNHHATLPDNIGELIKQTLGYGEGSTTQSQINTSYVSDLGEVAQDSRSKNLKSCALTRRNSSSPVGKRRVLLKSGMAVAVPKRLNREFLNPDFSCKDAKSLVTKIKCQYCNFRTPRQGDLNRHVNRCHQFKRKASPSMPNSPPKPLPCLIPIKSRKPKESSDLKVFNLERTANKKSELKLENNQNFSRNVSPIPKELELEEKVDQNTSDSFEEKSAFLEYFALTPVAKYVSVDSRKNGGKPTDSETGKTQACTQTGPKILNLKGSAPRRRTSFFEKLTQKLVANIKSDERSHKGSTTNNSITITSNSNRCQYCRHRCKTSIDLIAHLGKCPDARRSLEDDDIKESETGNRKVFVWNSSPDEYDTQQGEVPEMKPTGMGEGYDLIGYETSPGIGSVHHFEGLTSPETDLGNSVTTSRKVYRCPQQNCGFWATTASRFHVHIVGHYNLKPFECSQCSYRSNWRWDITKHIRLKSLRDTAHAKAKVLLTHESGQRNYRKYDRYLVGMDLKYSADSKLPDCSTVASKRGDVELNPPSMTLSPMSSPTPSHLQQSTSTPSPKLKMPKLTKAPVSRSLILESLMKEEDVSGTVGPPPILRPMSESHSGTIRTFVEAKMLAGGEISLGTCSNEVSITPVRNPKLFNSENSSSTKTVQRGINPSKKPVWKCKKCPFKHPNKEVVLIHLRQSHKPKKGEAVSILNQNNLTTVGEDGGESDGYQDPNQDISSREGPYQYAYDALEGLFKCKFCPFFTTTSNAIQEHLENHAGKQTSHFSCAYCSIIMSSRRELLQHMKVHGSEQIADDNTGVNFDGLISPEETPPKPRGSTTGGGPTYKKYHCMECPYVTDSKRQFLYHKQFHTLRDSPFKCNSCSYNVSHKHLLHQHIRVHGPHVSKPDAFEEHDDGSDDGMRCSEDEQLESSRPTVLVWKNGRPFRMFRCQFCPQVFGKLVDLSEHEEEHNQEPISCPEAINLSTKIIPDPRNNFKNSITVSPRGSNLLNMPPSLAFVSPALPKSVLYLCDDCPARFFYEKELKIHHTFHVKTSEFKCQLCSYSARQQTPHLMSHMKVHGREYQIKTEMLLSKYPKAAPIDFDSPGYSSPISITPTRPGISGLTITKDESFKPDASIHCKICPAKFNTLATSQHHYKNHGRLTGYTCRHCNFGADTLNNLTLHEILHAGSEITIEPEPALSNFTKHSPASSHSSMGVDSKLGVGGTNDDLNEGAFLGNPEFIYPTYVKNGRVKSKRYKCNKCPSAFEKRDQYRVHTGLHGSDQRYKCTVCDYAVTYYANFIQHLKKHSNQPNVPPELLIVKPLSKLRNEASQALANSKLPKIIKDASNPDGDKLRRPIKCGRCPYTTCSAQAFEEHISHHVTGKRKMDLLAAKCPFCNFIVSKHNLLRDHIRLHFNVSKTTNSTPTTHMFIEDVEISVNKGDQNEKLYCEKENYNEKYESKDSSADSKRLDSITIVDMRCGLPVSLLSRKGDIADSVANSSQPE